ncbi:VOC family protein [Bacillus daqingensis]|uniref:VOC family protein n=1 Tax=Bacillus daqingensis TaxID=872396 RepID=A0ABV9NTN5_9BACI
MNFHRKPVTHVSRVSLKVEDLERALRFYTTVIGFQVTDQTARTAELTAGGTVLLTLEQPEDVMPKQPRTTGLFHFALLVPDRADVGRFIKHSVKHGNVIQGASDHRVSEALYLSDPDGNGIEIYADRDPSSWPWTNDQVGMVTEPLDVESLLEAAGDTEWNGLPEGTVMGHIHLHVSDMERDTAFYTDVLGLSIVSSYGGQANFLSDSRYHHHVALNVWNGRNIPAPAENSVGLRHYTIAFPSEDARQNVLSRLEQTEAAVTRERDVISTADPAGNRIQLVVEG